MFILYFFTFIGKERKHTNMWDSTDSVVNKYGCKRVGANKKISSLGGVSQIQTQEKTNTCALLTARIYVHTCKNEKNGYAKKKKRLVFRVECTTNKEA